MFQNVKFQEGLAEFLKQTSSEALSRFSATVWKADGQVDEIRDTMSPGLITQCLLPMLETLGSSINVPILRKRVRDDVNFDKALRPWRRHPFWLVLRVAAQRHLCLTLGDLKGRAVYKFLVTTVLGSLLKQCPTRLEPELTSLLRGKVCRRLAKLEMEKALQEDSDTYRCLFQVAGSHLKSVVESVTADIELDWNRFKITTTRIVPKLPQGRFRPSETDYIQSLQCSGRYLDELLWQHDTRLMPSSASDIHAPHIADESMKQVLRFRRRYRDLADFEKELEL